MLFSIASYYCLLVGLTCFFIKHVQLVSERGSAVEGQVSTSLRLTVSIEIEKKWYSWEVIDSYVGLELEGRIDFTVDLRIVGGLRFVAMQ